MVWKFILLIVQFEAIHQIIIFSKVKIKTTSHNSVVFFKDSNHDFLCFGNPDYSEHFQANYRIIIF